MKLAFASRVEAEQRSSSKSGVDVNRASVLDGEPTEGEAVFDGPVGGGGTPVE